MDAVYLRIRNWGELQHYTDRRPPWIKVYPRLLEDDAFARLDEVAQWQLVRIWFVASRSTSAVLDDAGREVPVVANDALSLQRSIQSLKKVPLAKLIREGWLIPVSEDELIPPTERKPVRKRPASRVASTTLDPSIEAETQRNRNNKGLFVAHHVDAPNPHEQPPDPGQVRTLINQSLKEAS